MIKLKHLLIIPQKTLRFSFTRKVKESGTLKERQIYHKDSAEIETIHEHKLSERVDPNSKEADESFISHCRLNPQHLPERLLKRIHQIFSKYPTKDLRKYGADYLKIYRELNSSEKPILDYNKTKPFANTEQMAESDPNMIYLRAKKWERDQVERKVEEKRAEKEKKKASVEQSIAQEVEENKKKEDVRTTLDYTQNTALGFLLKKMPNTFVVACRVLTEIRYRQPKFNPKNFLDFGAGMGSGSWAFQDVYPDGEHIVACEPSKVMRKAGKHLTQDISKIIWIDMLAQTAVYDYAKSFDLVYCGYVLEEAKSAESRLLLLESLWQKVNPDGYLVIIDTGTPRGFRFIHDIRRWVIQKPRTEANILAPCPHHGKCPLSDKGSWCHFDQPMGVYPNSVFPKAKREETIFYEKFSYLIIKKGEVKSEQKKDEIEELPAFEKSYEWGRIVRPIMTKAKHKIIDICNKDAELERYVVARSHEGGIYKETKKLRWGDLWRYGMRIPNRFRKESLKGKRLW